LIRPLAVRHVPLHHACLECLGSEQCDDLSHFNRRIEVGVDFGDLAGQLRSDFDRDQWPYGPGGGHVPGDFAAVEHCGFELEGGCAVQVIPDFQ
jgi:hypothetical protein